MRNLLFKISFDGSSFHGWQIQNDLRTVQGELKKAFFELTNEDVVICKTLFLIISLYA